MRRILTLAAALLGGWISSVPATAQTAAEQRELDRVLDRGRLLFALDRAAWLATDDFRERVPDFATSGSIGYIVDRDEGGFIPIFFGRENGALVAFYRARFGPDGITEATVYGPGRRPALTPVQARMARILLAMRQVRWGSCTGGRENISIIPPSDVASPIEVYLTAPQLRPGSFQFGGHHRFVFDAADNEIEQRAFTNGCLSVPAPPADLRAGGEMLGVTHLLDPLPTEVHVFIAMAAEQTIAVITGPPNRLWGVSGDSIRLLQEGGSVPDPGAEPSSSSSVTL